MMCAWNELLSILPIRLRKMVDQSGRELLQELRLRVNAPPELVFENNIRYISGNISLDELSFVINAASKYSPWSISTISKGYITAPGGHRIGICGDVVLKEGKITGVREVHSICIRIARDYPGIGIKAAMQKGSILILGAPGWGKTTLLRDVIRRIGEKDTVCVVDERREVFPVGICRGKRVDVITGCPKSIGIDMLLRTMGPKCIAVDEITEEEDCNTLIRSANCGVRLMATAHASSVEEFYNRKVYQKLVRENIFNTLIVLNKDKSYRVERVA